MKTLLIVLAIAVSANVSAMDIQAIAGKASSKIVKLSDSEVEALWASNKAVCLKDGSSLIGVNKAFNDASLKSRDCSASESAQIKAKALGHEVVVVKLSQLSPSKIKQTLGVK